MNEDFKLENIISNKTEVPKSDPSKSEVKEESKIDFTLLRTLQAKKQDNQIVKKLSR